MAGERRRDPGSQMPRGRRDGRGRATYWGSSVFTSTYGGKCRRCGGRIEPGDYVQEGHEWRNAAPSVPKAKEMFTSDELLAKRA